MNSFQRIWPMVTSDHRSTALKEDRDGVLPRRLLMNHSAMRPTPQTDLFSLTKEELQAHCRRSLRATLITFALGMALFALFFGLVAACDRL
jgi:hypothetical protein